MKRASVLVLLTLLTALPTPSLGQALTPSVVDEVLEALAEQVAESYVFPEKGAAAVAEVRAMQKRGELDGLEAEAFAERASEALARVADDRHFRIRYRPPGETAQTPSPIDQFEEQVTNASGRQIVTRVEVLEGNVGLVEVATFTGGPRFYDEVTAAIRLLSSVDAVIVDVRENGGGSPDNVQFLSSFFLPPGAPLNSIYRRTEDRVRHFEARDELPAPRLDDRPLFILTSSRTGSGAEGFAYNFKANRHGTLLGESTWGGAQPGAEWFLPHGFLVFLSNGRAEHPLTKSNWEGTGVEPDVPLSAEEAYAEAVRRAGKAAEERRKERTSRRNEWLSRTRAELESDAPDLDTLFDNGFEEGYLSEGLVNGFGYSLLAADRPGQAERVLAQNVRRFPDSPNVYDSHGESLLSLGRRDEAVARYEKAVDLGTTQEHPLLDAFRQGLQRAREATETSSP